LADTAIEKAQTALRDAGDEANAFYEYWERSADRKDIPWNAKIEEKDGKISINVSYEGDSRLAGGEWMNFSIGGCGEQS